MTLSTIDPKAGTHFNDMKVTISQHARERAVQRFGIQESDVNSYVVDRLKRASLVDECFTADDGKSGRLFVYEGVCYIVAPDAPFLLTVYQNKYDIVADVMKPVSNAIKRVIKAAQRTERAELLRLNRERAELNVKIAENELAIVNTTRPSRIKALTTQVAEYKTKIRRIDDEIASVKRAKSSVMKSVSVFI